MNEVRGTMGRVGKMRTGEVGRGKGEVREGREEGEIGYNKEK